MASANQSTSDFKGDSLSVKMFGAIGDGVADDSVALQAAFDYGSLHRSSIRIPPGNYKHSAGLRITGACCVYGDAGMGLGQPLLSYTGTGTALKLANATPGQFLYAPVLRNIGLAPTHPAAIGIHLELVSGLIADKIAMGNSDGSANQFAIGWYWNQAGLAHLHRPLLTNCDVGMRFDDIAVAGTDFGACAGVHIWGGDMYQNRLVFDVRSASQLTLDGVWIESFDACLNFDNSSVARIFVDSMTVSDCTLLAGTHFSSRKVINGAGAAGKPFEIDKLTLSKNRIFLPGSVQRPVSFAVTSASFGSVARFTLRDNYINAVGADTSSADGVMTSGSPNLAAAGCTFTAAMVGQRVKITGSVDLESKIATFTDSHHVVLADNAPGSGTGLNVWVEGAIAYADAGFVEGEFRDNFALGSGAAWTPYDGAGYLSHAGIHQRSGQLGIGRSNAHPTALVDICDESPTGVTALALRAGPGQGFSALGSVTGADGKAGLLLDYLGQPGIAWQKALAFAGDPANGTRWALSLSGTETGSNAGSRFVIQRFSDVGAFLGTPVDIDRATGAATLADLIANKLNIAAGYGTLPKAFGDLAIGAVGSASSSPNIASLCFGDGSGWRIRLGGNVAGTFTPKIDIYDNGHVDMVSLTATGAITTAANVTGANCVGGGTDMASLLAATVSLQSQITALKAAYNAHHHTGVTTGAGTSGTTDTPA